MKGPAKDIKLGQVTHRIGLIPGLIALMFAGVYCWYVVKTENIEMLIVWLGIIIGYWFRGKGAK